MRHLPKPRIRASRLTPKLLAQVEFSVFNFANQKGHGRPQPQKGEVLPLLASEEVGFCFGEAV